MRSARPARFRVLWGDPFKAMTQVIVEAFDREQALVVAHELRPDLPRPRTAFLIEDVDDRR